MGTRVNTRALAPVGLCPLEEVLERLQGNIATPLCAGDVSRTATIFGRCWINRRTRACLFIPLVNSSAVQPLRTKARSPSCQSPSQPCAGAAPSLKRPLGRDFPCTTHNNKVPECLPLVCPKNILGRLRFWICPKWLDPLPGRLYKVLPSG